MFKCGDYNKIYTLNNSISMEEDRVFDERPVEGSSIGNGFWHENKIPDGGVHPDGKSFVCDICDKRFTNNSNLKRHLKIHIGEKPFECDICKKVFSQKGHLEEHLRVHTGEKPYECNICKRQFSQENSLKIHTRIHTGEKPYECNICKRKFSREHSLKTHLRIHTGEKPFDCDICKKKFSQEINLKTHLRTHTGEKPYECNICKRKFSQENLKRHMRSHTGEKPYECNICKGNFSQKVSLNRHMRIHTGEKPYRCHICNKEFSQKGVLKTHIRIHTGENPFECNICERKFLQKSALKTHSRIHTGEKPYECNICLKTFSQKRNLNIHMRTHTGEKPYGCDICYRNFSQENSLKRHILIHTGKNSQDVIQHSVSLKSSEGTCLANVSDNKVICVKEEISSGFDSEHFVDHSADPLHTIEECLNESLSDLDYAVLPHSGGGSSQLISIDRASGDGHALKGKIKKAPQFKQEKFSHTVETVTNDDLDCQIKIENSDPEKNTCVGLEQNQQTLLPSIEVSGCKELRLVNYRNLNYIENKVDNYIDEEKRENYSSVSIANNTVCVSDDQAFEIQRVYVVETNNSGKSDDEYRKHFQCCLSSNISVISKENEESLSSVDLKEEPKLL